MANNNYKKNTIYNIIKSCSTILFPLITFPYISRVLEAENIGKVNFSNSIVSYFALFASLGITTYAVREVSYYRNDLEKLEEISSEIFSINLITTFISYALLLVTLFLFPNLEGYNALIIIQSTSIFLTTLGADWLNTAMEDFRYITIRTFSFQLLALILMFIFVRTPKDYIIYAMISVISSSGGNIANYFYRKKYCNIRFTKKLNLSKHLSPIITLFGMILAQQVFVNSDTTIIGIIKGNYEVGLYSTSVKIYSIASTLLSSLFWVVLPKLSASFRKKDFGSINSTLKFVTGFTATIGFPVVIGMFMLSSEIIYLIAGSEYLPATSALQVLSISLLFSLFWGVVMNMLLLPEGREKICLLACSVSAILNITFNFIFIPQFGFIAAAYTTALSQLVGLLICAPFVNKRVIFYLPRNFLFSIAIGSVSVVAVIIVLRMVVLNKVLIFFLSVIFSVIIYFIIQVTLKNYWVLDFFQTSILKNIKNKRNY
uniref:Capsular polysaccharide repeat unit transporter n=1 Tax=Streptococcus suis TaxID=1307 RepID=M1VJY8_STRSU|nr:capsular polysaccharide repeat unit transporter [Streptococcus suis]